MAVRNVSLQIERGSIYGLLGPNGAGKSTTLKMLVGLLRPTGGRIILDGRPWQRESLSKIGSLIESPALYGNLTAEENLLVHTRLLKIPKTKITEVLETVNLKNTGKKRVSQFSMGMKQRLGIASALLNDPELLILDEPTNGLDPFWHSGAEGTDHLFFRKRNDRNPLQPYFVRGCPGCGHHRYHQRRKAFISGNAGFR